jgi:hypothetical protein
MCRPTIFDPFRHFRHLLSGASAESWAQHGCRPKSHCYSVIFQTTLAPRVIRDVVDDNCAKSHPRQPYTRDVADDTCVFNCLAQWVMHTQRGEVNGIQVCKYRNLMRQEGSE